jgi:hypothetical protein
MNSLDYWRWCDELTIWQAALLCVDIDPSSNEGINCLNWQVKERPAGFEAVRSALFSAFMKGLITGREVAESNIDINGNEYFIPDTIDKFHSIIEVESLKAWMVKRGLNSSFFISSESGLPSYLNKDHHHYSPKLAAAIYAWQAVSNDEKYKDNGKTFKQNLINWLISHAAEFGLIKDNGEINNLAIENQIAMVSNCDTLGGAAKTPT